METANISTLTISKREIDAAIDELTEEYRSMCLWFAPRRYLPTCDQQRFRTLDNIEKYGDRAAFKRSRELREWLLLYSKKE